MSLVCGPYHAMHTDDFRPLRLVSWSYTLHCRLLVVLGMRARLRSASLGRPRCDLDRCYVFGPWTLPRYASSCFKATASARGSDGFLFVRAPCPVQCTVTICLSMGTAGGGGECASLRVNTKRGEAGMHPGAQWFVQAGSEFGKASGAASCVGTGDVGACTVRRAHPLACARELTALATARSQAPRTHPPIAVTWSTSGGSRIARTAHSRTALLAPLNRLRAPRSPRRTTLAPARAPHAKRQ